MVLKKKNSLIPLSRNFPKLQIEEIPISSLKWNARSPRVHPEKQIEMLARNIDTFGFLIPCLISDQNRLLCGNARVLSAMRLGMETVPAVRVSHLSDNDQRVFILADAKLSEHARWHPEILQEEIQFTTNLNIDLDLSVIGFETAEVDFILERMEEQIEDDPTESLRPQAISRSGDIWRAGEHRVCCGDALSERSYDAVLGSNKAGLVVIVLIAGAILAVSLVAQLAADRYKAPRYWFTVLMVAVTGTMAADGVHVELGVPYAVSTAFFSVVLALVFVAWFRAEGTLSIHSILTPRRELFYWAVVMATFALGTAAGDLTAFSLGWGFFASAVLFGVLFAAAFVARWRFGVGEVAAFWFAYIVTRPLGASLADLFAAPKTLGGLGFGYGRVSVILAILIAGFVAYLAIGRPNAGTLDTAAAIEP